MTRYFLTRLRVEGFRGINNDGDPLELRFDPTKVNSVFAVNGTGKNSIFEALCFAIRGSVSKLDSLTAAEKPDQYYVNKFDSAGTATVEMEFVSDDVPPATVSIVVTRSSSGARAVSSPSGHADPESFLASLDEAFSLLDYQNFSTFIEDSPLNRGRSFAALLGLSAYSDLRQAVRAAADTRVLDSDLELSGLNTRIQGFEETARSALVRMQASYQQLIGKELTDVGSLDTCAAEVRGALAGVALIANEVGPTLGDIDFDALITSIKAAEGGDERQELSRLIQEINSITTLGEPNMSTPKELAALKAIVEALDELMKGTRGEHCKHLYDAAASMLESDAWPNSNVCPLCDSTLDRAISEIVEEQLTHYATVTEKVAEIEGLWRDAPFVKRLSVLESNNLLGVGADERLSDSFRRKVANGSLTTNDVD